MRSERVRIGALMFAVGGLVFFGCAISRSEGSQGGELISKDGASRRVYFRTVDLADSADVRQWAEKMCRRETLDSFAEELGVAPDIASLVDAVAKGMPVQARDVVRQVFTERLR